MEIKFRKLLAVCQIKLHLSAQHCIFSNYVQQGTKTNLMVWMPGGD